MRRAAQTVTIVADRRRVPSKIIIPGTRRRSGEMNVSQPVPSNSQSYSRGRTLISVR